MAVIKVSAIAHDGYIIGGHKHTIPSDAVSGRIVEQSMYNRVLLSDPDGKTIGNPDYWSSRYKGRLVQGKDVSDAKSFYLRDENGNIFRLEAIYQGDGDYTNSETDPRSLTGNTRGLVLQPVDDQGVNLPGVGTITTYVPHGLYNNSPFFQDHMIDHITIVGEMKHVTDSWILKTSHPPGTPKIRWCFVAGANILTDAGYALVETLKVGDLIWTANHGFQPLRWIGRSVLDAIDLSVNPKLRPVFISKGALGGGLPESDLRVSRQHRMLLSSDLVNSICDEKEVLVAAIKLTDHPKIYVDEDIKTVEYFHILFDDHQIIKADGALTESLYIGEEVLKTMTPEAYAEIIALFPEIGDVNYKPLYARTILDGKMRKNLIAKHLEVGVDFV